MPPDQDPIISAAALAERRGDPRLRIVDATWFMPGDPRDARQLHRDRRIPGAVFFDIDAIADHAVALPHMLPTPEAFADSVGALGIGDGASIIVYDALGLFSAPRVWWSFRAMGHDDVRVLDGGLPAWERAGLPTESGEPASPQPARFKARLKPELVRSFEDVSASLGSAAILDARPAPRFRGEASEPRPGLRSGHMPGAANVPSASLLTADGHLRPREELAALLSDALGDPASPIICTCGSGVSAAIIALALARLGRWDAAIYDGSWTEWGARADAPVAVGA